MPFARGHARMIRHARSLRDGADLRADVCIVGAGPAGLTLASALSGHGLRVLVLEGGGMHTSSRDQRMLLGRTTGSPYWRLESIRVRRFGGSANRWGGICRPLDEVDFDARPWVDHSGWPIAYADVARHYPAAAETLGLEEADFGRPPDGYDRSGAPPLPTDGGFDYAYYRISPQLRYGALAAPAIEALDDVTVVLDANVTAVRSDRSAESVDHLDVRSHGGGAATVRASAYVLAGGGIENARLLLASDDVQRGGLGNEHDTVGRYFMEHVHAPVASFVPAPDFAGWSSYLELPAAPPKLVHALALTPEAQREAGLLNATLAIGPPLYFANPPFVHWDYRMLASAERTLDAVVDDDGRPRGPLAPVLDRLQPLWHRMSGWDFRKAPRTTPVDADLPTVFYRGEQTPRPTNRVTLGFERDALGRPRAALHWQPSTADLANAVDVRDAFEALARKQGWGTVQPVEGWERRLVGGPHHLGTTRMSADPRDGVVDPDLRVHSVDNLYVAGSSVFPTGGHANPTLTVVALSLRLAAHLRETLR